MSYHPEDVRDGYCGACHDWTGRGSDPYLQAKIIAEVTGNRIEADMEAVKRVRALVDEAVNRGDEVVSIEALRQALAD